MVTVVSSTAQLCRHRNHRRFVRPVAAGNQRDLRALTRSLTRLPHRRLVPTTPVLLLLTSALVGCGFGQPTQSEPSSVGEQLPGSVHVESDPAQAPRPVEIQHVWGGDVSRRSHQFSQGQTISYVASTLPGQVGLVLNGTTCAGQFGITASTETDVLLILEGEACSVEVLGSHPETVPHVDSAP